MNRKVYPITFVLVLCFCLASTLSAANEPTQELIPSDSITASASSQYLSGDTYAPFRCIDGSGLNEDFEHNDGSADVVWMSDNVVGGSGASNPHPGTTAGAEWIKFELDQSYSLGLMYVWNYNYSTTRTDRGLKKVYIEYTNDGNSYSKLLNGSDDFWIFNEAPGTPGYVYNTIIDFGGVDANAVVITADFTDGNWGSASLWGLSEIAFGIYGTEVCDPDFIVDLDGDCFVDLRDFAMLAENWMVFGGVQ